MFLKELERALDLAVLRVERRYLVEGQIGVTIVLAGAVLLGVPACDDHSGIVGDDSYGAIFGQFVSVRCLLVPIAGRSAVEIESYGLRTAPVSVDSSSVVISRELVGIGDLFTSFIEPAEKLIAVARRIAKTIITSRVVRLRRVVNVVIRLPDNERARLAVSVAVVKCDAYFLARPYRHYRYNVARVFQV